MQSIKSTINNATQPVRKLGPLLKGRLPNVLPKGLIATPNTTRVPKRIILKPLLHWCHVIWKDVFWIAVILLPILFISRSAIFKPRDRLFPMWKDPQTGLWMGPLEYSYPPKPMILSTLLCTVVLIAPPLAIFAFMQLFVRSVWDWTAASLGLIEAISLMTIIQVISKQYIGAFRPYFLSACNPLVPELDKLYWQSLTSSGNVDLPYHRVFATSAICDPEADPVLLRRAMQSWPSGHTGTAFAACVFLSLYLNAKLKAFSDYKTRLWKMFASTAPLIGAILIAGGLTIDHNHHASDILTSIPLGIFSALLAYRARYLSLFDYRTNHIPLVHGGIGQSVLPSSLPAASGAALPVGQYVAVRWPKTPLGELPLSVPNLPALPGGIPNLPSGVPGVVPDLPGDPPSVPNLPASAPSTPNLPSAADAAPKAKRFGRSGKSKAPAGDGTDEEEHDDNATLNDYTVDVPGAFLSERRGTNDTVVPISRRRRSGGANSSGGNDVRVKVRMEEGARGEQMV